MSLWGNTDNLAGAPKWLAPTLTIDATSNTVVIAASDSIVYADHGLVTGDPVTYSSDDANNVIVGLTDSTLYYAIRVDEDTIKLASNTSNAIAGTAVDITDVGLNDADTLQKTPDNLYFVDTTEVGVAANKAKGFTAPGWWVYETYTDSGSNTRHKAVCVAELSVAVGTSGDAGVDGSDDAVVADS